MPTTTAIKVGESATTITLNQGKVLLVTGAANAASAKFDKVHPNGLGYADQANYIIRMLK